MAQTKKKILMISDHPLGTSGVGTQAQWLVRGLVATGRYTFRCLGAAIRHANHDVMAPLEDFIIRPIDGFGNPDMIRNMLVTERPDAMLIFSDPRFFTYLWEMIDEVHQVCPLAYWHLWDEMPAPQFNRPFYESTDLINCINRPTFDFLNDWYPERVKDGSINYVPHAVPREIYSPLTPSDRESIRKKLYGPKADHVLALYVSRNARRKRPSDILWSWKIFLDQLESKHGHRNASIVMHCDPHDHEGPDLSALVDLFGLKDNVIFSGTMVEFADMRALYGSVDFLVNMSYNEGFGLGVLEAQQCGTPAIVTRTGGLTRQVENHVTGEQHGIVVDPVIKTLVGQQMTPYIYEAYASTDDYAAGFMRFYEMGEKGRMELGRKASQYALHEYAIESMVEQWDKSLMRTVENWSPPRGGAYTVDEL